MKLKSLHSPWMLPIPGSHRREMSLHAADGWTLVRHEDGRVSCRRSEAIDGGTAERNFVLEAWPLAYEVEMVPTPPVVDAPTVAKAKAKK